MFSGRKHFFATVLTNGLARGLSFVVSLIMVSLILREHGRDNFGVYAVFISISSYILALDLGIADALQTVLSNASTLSDWLPQLYHSRSLRLPFKFMNIPLLLLNVNSALDNLLFFILIKLGCLPANELLPFRGDFLHYSTHRAQYTITTK